MDAPRSRRRSTPFLLGLIAILAALPLGYFLFLHEPPAPPPPPVVEAPPVRPQEEPKRPAELKLEEVSGTVEVRRGAGEWRPVKAGEALRPSDSVRTLHGSYAVVINGEAVEVRMDAGTELTIEELTHSLSRFLLRKGRTTTRVRPGARQTVEVTAAGSDAVARTEGGTFAMSNNGAGTVAVATREGEVTFLGRGKVVIVRAGQQSIVLPGRGPSDPTPIPSSLLLKVSWPARSTVSKRQLVVSGQTEPGAHVDVAGEFVLTDEHGRFSRPVSLQEGRNTMQVQALSVGGLHQQEQHDLTVDTRPPDKVIVDPGMWSDPAPKRD